jgi:GNAT superfamily N-acetyltransferase
MSKIKVRRINREELAGAAILRDVVAAELAAYPASRGTLDLDMEIDPNLRHLMAHDPDGFFTATDHEETLGFAAAHIRSRQCVLSELWVLPQHHGRGAGRALLERIIGYGERSGVKEYLAVVPAEPAVQALLLGHSYRPLTPVYQFSLERALAAELAPSLARLLPGRDTTTDLFNRRGQADIDRIDRVTRNISREVDHLYWLKERRLKAAFVQQGARIAAYAYGSAEQIGPVAGSTPDAALSGLGWALQLAVESGAQGLIEVRVPAPFAAAIEAMLDGGARLEATLIVYGRGLALAFDRSILGPVCLP